MADIEQQARELLAAEYDADGRAFTARQIRADPGALGDDIARSIRAISAALRTKATTLATVKPPRNRRTRLREDV